MICAQNTRRLVVRAIEHGSIQHRLFWILSKKTAIKILHLVWLQSFACSIPGWQLSRKWPWGMLNTSVIKWYNLVLAKGRWWCVVGKVNTGLAEIDSKWQPTARVTYLWLHLPRDWDLLHHQCWSVWLIILFLWL